MTHEAPSQGINLDRKKDRINSGMEEFLKGFSNRDFGLEEQITHKIFSIGELPARPQTPDLEYVESQSQLLLKKIGVGVRPIEFVKDPKAAEHFLTSGMLEFNSDWATNWRELRDQALDSLRKRQSKRGDTYLYTLWDAVRNVAGFVLPTLELPPNLARKTKTRLTAAAQNILVESDLSVSEPFEPFVETARQGAYIIGMNSGVLRVYTPPLRK